MAGLAFSVQSLSQAIGSYLASKLDSKIKFRFVQLGGSITMILALFLMGPSSLCEVLQNKIWVIFVGLIVMGFSTAFICAKLILEILDSEGSAIMSRITTNLKNQGLDD